MIDIKEDLISVIITSYNHAQFLPESIQSVIEQTYKNIEVILVDDGSSDNTKEVVADYPGVQYVYQQNQGLSAARNTGIDQSKGQYLVFLDADDWFLPDALALNLNHIKQNHKAAFASGAHIKVDEFKKQIPQKQKPLITEHHYLHLLQHNYIQMHAAVIYQRWVFGHFRFDTSLRACEDYDIYLKVARKFPVVHHQDLIAVYRRHGQNMSMNIPLILQSSLNVLKRQTNNLQNEQEKICFNKGIKFWPNLYSKELYGSLRKSPLFPIHKKRRAELSILFQHKKPLFFKYVIIHTLMSSSSILKKKV